ncbi:MAG: GTPase Era [Nitrospinota bacterium]|nr:GTPase Era [Nitrospinota bacterium]MDH5677601.1 GTPase Era [Nitrospinota bacterium]MDH5756519.1 GTPase Era [Nitrospinota bacterium]
MGKSGFVSLLGRANVGKSTLINRLVGRKISIISPRPQTTRNRIIGVKSGPFGQVVFMDTPGVAFHKSALSKSMIQAAEKAGAECDLAVFMADATSPDMEGDREAINRLGLDKGEGDIILAINKVDAIPKERLLGQIDKLRGLAKFIEIIPISAKNGENVDKLFELILERMPEGPAFYPEEMTTDQPENFVIGEIVREKAFLLLGQEMPYSVAVEVDSIEDKPGVTVIIMTLYVERDSQKGIVIGKNGAMLKKIGSSARLEMERRLGVKVFLDIRVKVKEKWTSNRRAFRDFGYGSE